MSKPNLPFTVLRSVFNTLRSSEQIYYPLIIVIFINFIILEFLYFAPRFPLSTFFAPIIRRIWGEEFLHYPINLALLPKMFYYVQIFIYLFAGSFLLAVTTHMVAAINNNERVNFKASLRKSLPGYISIIFYSILSLVLFQAFNSLYGLLINRALKIHSTQGIFFWIKKTIILGFGPVQFISDIFITVLLVYLIPIIILERKKIFKALAANFKMLFGSFWSTMVIVFVPTVFYIPILLMRNNTSFLVKMSFPEIQIIIMALGIIATVVINTFVLMAATTCYLYKKEHS